MKFAEALHTGRCPKTGFKLLEEETVALMHRDHLGDMGVKRTSMAAMFQGIGLGVHCTTTSAEPNAFMMARAGIGTGGWGGAAFTQYCTDTENQLSWVGVSQLLGYTKTMQLVRNQLNHFVYLLFPDLKACDTKLSDGWDGAVPLEAEAAFTG